MIINKEDIGHPFITVETINLAVHIIDRLDTNYCTNRLFISILNRVACRLDVAGNWVQKKRANDHFSFAVAAASDVCE